MINAFKIPYYWDSFETDPANVIETGGQVYIDQECIYILWNRQPNRVTNF